ncbi:MAG: arylsulfatase [Cyclobacteriaceae bacterium]
MNSLYKILVFAYVISSCQSPQGTESKVVDKGRESNKPNIIIIYADDLGYGDLSCYGATEIQTPNFDRISAEGVRFTNGYATSATCTPSRYAMLSGEYPWRNDKAEILAGNAPLLFDVSRITMPGLLKKEGYKTAVIGKWHLGLGGQGLDWNGKISPGPNEIGFEYSYIMASTNDRVPTVYVENDKVVGLESRDSLKVFYPKFRWQDGWNPDWNYPGEPTGLENPELLKLQPSHGHDMSIHNGISRIGFMKGGKSALWVDEHMADTILNRSQQFIIENKDNPFFLFYSLHQPHVPRTPHSRFVGKSGMGARGDAILEADWCVGQILQTLDVLGISDNTIVIFSSDNGPVLDDGYRDLANELVGDHKAAGGLRGGKYSLFDAGTRVPFMIRWPDKIKPGVSDALVCQMDLMNSFAKVIGADSVARDSQDLSPAFFENSVNGRENLITEAMGRLAVRSGKWVLIPPYEGELIVNQWVKNETGFLDAYQLYNLENDPGQKLNLANKYPEVVERMKSIISESI